MDGCAASGRAIFTAIAVVYLSSFTIQPAMLGTGGASFGPGVRWDLTSAGKQHLQIGDGSSFAKTATADGAMTDSAWHFLAVSINEPAGAGGSFFHRDGAYDPIATGNTFDGSYSSPSASAAAFQMQLGAGGNNPGRLSSGSRMLGFAMLPTAAKGKPR